MPKKYQIFVSSTFTDLVEERQDAIRNILDLGHIPAGMELFPAADTEQLQYIKRVIDECDYYFLIMGGRYGSLDNEGISYTEREYDYAVETGKVALAFPHADLTSLPVKKSDLSAEQQKRLSAFREKVMTGRLVRQWKNRQELDGLVTRSLARAMSEYPAVGWIRANVAANEDMLQQVNSLRLENERLKGESEAVKALIAAPAETLASGDEMFTLHFTHKYKSGGYSREAKVEEDVSWNEIFRALGQQLDLARPTSLIGHYIERHFKDVRDDNRNLDLVDTDSVTIKVQLRHLGLIKTYASASQNGQYYEWMTLTPAGQRKFDEMVAVRSTKKD